ncbi:MAG: DUF2953 domain-containing protein [Oscillibacter sp.]|nr:DUF2953 domain-containing protein [Oscillibacter sp.]
MLWLKILAGIAVLFALFCLTRLGIRVELGDIVSADVTFGFLRFRVAPLKAKKKKPKKETVKKEPKDLTKTLKKFPRPTLKDLKTAYQMLWPPSQRALRRFGRGIRVHPLTMSLTLAGKNDPAGAAEAYGDICAVMWTVMPPLEELINIPKPSLHVGVDFDAAALRVRGQVGVSLRIGTLLAMGFDLLIPGIRWLMKFQEAHKQDEPQPDKKAETPPAAA